MKAFAKVRTCALGADQLVAVGFPAALLALARVAGPLDGALTRSSLAAGVDDFLSGVILTTGVRAERWRTITP